MRLDHVSYAVARDSFVSTVQWIGSALGAGFVDGGVHPRFGTRNFILPLSGGTYVEVVTTLDHPAAD
ncbi:VOC family protein, partial [Streptomyces sp. NPDC004667]